jgi:hypothetical protein
VVEILWWRHFDAGDAERIILRVLPAGRGSFLPDYIKTIGVPTFDNRTTLFNLETQVTAKVRSEFIGRGITRSFRTPRTWTRC